MAMIRAFRGLRYAGKAGPIEKLIAPPYDVIGADHRDRLAAQSDKNVVALTIPPSQPDDRSKFVKYARSAATLAEWRRDGTLELESKPTLYRYTQTFDMPDGSGSLARTQLMALLKVEPYENEVVLPHEQTFPKHKEDRLRILEATRSHLECIYGLYEDPGRAVHDRIVAAPATLAIESRNEDGVREKLELIQDDEVIQSLVDDMADKRVWIADGHHRYETAVHFRETQGPKEALIPEDFMMMALSSMSDPGLVILPTHRIVKNLPVPESQLDDLFQTKFNVRRVGNSKLLEELAAISPTETFGLGVALPSGNGLFLTLDRPDDALQWIEGESSDRLKKLDVTILHRVVFEKLLGLSGLDFFTYTRDPEEALQAAQDGAAAFLMNPPTVDDMRTIALGRELMPQKSTYYYPKLSSGLVMWSLADF